MATVRRVFRHGEMTADFSTTPPTATITVPYMVEFTDQSAMPGDAVLATGLPVWGAVLGAMTLQRKVPRQVEKNHRRWIVECTYALPVPGTEPAPASPSDDKWNIQIDITTRRVEEEIQRDINGDVLANSVYDPIGGITILRADEDIVIGFTTDSPDWSSIDAAFGVYGRGCVNSDTLTLTLNGVARVMLPGTLHWEEYTMGATVDVSGAVYARMAYHLAWRAVGWRRPVADKGLNQLGSITIGSVTLYKVPITEDVPQDENGVIVGFHRQPVSNPLYLDGHGHTLGLGDGVIILPEGTTSGLGFELYEETAMGTVILNGLNT